MYQAFYNIGIHCLKLIYTLAGLFSPKARVFNNGRKNLFAVLEESFASEEKKVIWIHAASLGEFEQGRPVIERFKKEFTDFKILLTFFSPSGFEARKNYSFADYVFYLPWDLPQNATRFIQITQPKLAIFIKYEFWHNYIYALHYQKIPILSVSTILRKDHVYFQWYGNFFANTLRRIDHFFVQNDETASLLDSLGIAQHTVAGDTRFDQVKNILEQAERIPNVENFKNQKKLLIVGSAWQEDLDVVVPFINTTNNDWCFIIAPHEINNSFIEKIELSVSEKSIRYSQIKPDEDLSHFKTMIIDNIGMLSKLYRYADFAFVGGAFGKGLHNIMEASCNSIPVFFGNKNYKKFREAIDLIKLGAAFPVADYQSFAMLMEQLSSDKEYHTVQQIAGNYILQNIGATDIIMKYCRIKLISN